jgi:hypothetical protein
MIRHKIINSDEISIKLEGDGIYQNINWLKAINEGNGYEYMAVESSYDMRVVISIFFTTHKWPFKLAGAPLPGCFIDYMDPIADPEVNKDQLTVVLISQQEFLTGLGYSYIEWRVRQNIINIEDFCSKTNSKHHESGTLLLRISQSEDEMWAGMKSRSRNMVRKAEKNGASVELMSLKHVPEFYDMLTKMYSSQKKIPLHSLNLYLSLVRNLVKSNQLLFVSVKHNNHPVAMGMFPYNDHEIHFLSGASTIDGNSIGANNLMHWFVIQFSIKNKLDFYDFGGLGVPSIDKFKKSFGGSYYSYSKIVWETSLARLARKLFLYVLKIRKIWR